MTAKELVKALELEGFRVTIWGKNRRMLRLHTPPGKTISRELFDALVEQRPGVVEYLRAQGGVRIASPQYREEPPVVPVQGSPLTEQQLKLIDALTYADTIAQAGRIAGYGTRQAAHKAYNSILQRMPGVLRKALRTWCIRASG
jgi:hypothetical protein